MDPNPSPASRSGRGCCCFFIPRWERIRTSETDQTRPESESKWWRPAVEALRKAREWSEIVAGPKWKNFIRRINRRGGGSGKRFGYDPLGYALNFDGGNNDDDDGEYHGYSTRFVAAPGSDRGADAVSSRPPLVAAPLR